MTKKSFFYNNPLIYKIGLKIFHGKTLKKRYKLISEKIGKNKTVLEPACGPGSLFKYLDSSTKYSGFDINKKFVKYAKKKGLNVYLGNAYDITSYSKSDVVILSDALHHMGLKNEMTLLQYSLKNAKEMLIICDPFKKDYFKKFNWIPGIDKIMKIIYNYIEKDGNNKVDYENIRTEKKLRKDMEEGFGIIPKKCKREIYQIKEFLIVIYYLK